MLSLAPRSLAALALPSLGAVRLVCLAWKLREALLSMEVSTAPFPVFTPERPQSLPVCRHPQESERSRRPQGASRSHGDQALSRACISNPFPAFRILAPSPRAFSKHPSPRGLLAASELGLCQQPTGSHLVLSRLEAPTGQAWVSLFFHTQHLQADCSPLQTPGCPCCASPTSHCLGVRSYHTVWA